MAKTLSVNYTDTPITGGTTPSITVAKLNYKADFRPTVDEPKEVRLTNLTSPLDAPERWRFAYQDIADVYRNTGIDPTMYYQSRRGLQILCQLFDTYKVTDSADAAYLAMLPVEAHLVLRVPNNALLTSDIIRGLIGRMVGGIFDPSQTVDSRLSALLRGALMPASL